MGIGNIGRSPGCYQFQVAIFINRINRRPFNVGSTVSILSEKKAGFPIVIRGVSCRVPVQITQDCPIGSGIHPGGHLGSGNRSQLAVCIIGRNGNGQDGICRNLLHSEERTGHKGCQHEPAFPSN